MQTSLRCLIGLVGFWICSLNLNPIEEAFSDQALVVQYEICIEVMEITIPQMDAVTISYLDGSNFLICISYGTFFSLGLTMFTEDHYTLFLGLCSVSLVLYSADTHIPVPFLLFSFLKVGCILPILFIIMDSIDLIYYLDFHTQHSLL